MILQQVLFLHKTDHVQNMPSCKTLSLIFMFAPQGAFTGFYSDNINKNSKSAFQ